MKKNRWTEKICLGWPRTTNDVALLKKTNSIKIAIEKDSYRKHFTMATKSMSTMTRSSSMMNMTALGMTIMTAE